MLGGPARHHLTVILVVAIWPRVQDTDTAAVRYNLCVILQIAGLLWDTLVALLPHQFSEIFCRALIFPEAAAVQYLLAVNIYLNFCLHFQAPSNVNVA